MSKAWKPAKPTVELQPSRIRREPVSIRREPAQEQKKLAPRSRELEMWIGVAGIALFAIVIAMVTAGFSIITGHGDKDTAPPPHAEQFLRCGIGDGSDCVVDGDTIRIDDQTVNIAGIEAPKVLGAQCDKEAQRGGQSVEKLLELLNSGKVTTGGNVTEADGQARTKVLVNGADVATAMINAGAAREYGTITDGWCS